MAGGRPDLVSPEGSATVGIDLASQPKGTAACVIEWGTGAGRIAELAENLTDSAIVDLVQSWPAAKVGIDAPFGWPIAFVHTLTVYSAGSGWPEVGEKQLEFRATDRYVRTMLGRWPLSVSTNYIAYIAFRCAGLLTQLAGPGEVVDRTGAGQAVEVYPPPHLVNGASHQVGTSSVRVQLRRHGDFVGRRSGASCGKSARQAQRGLR